MKKRSPLDCPAAPQHFDGALIFAVFVDGHTVPVELTSVTEEWLTRCAPQTPRQVLRMAATCIKGRCRHWDAAQPGAEGDGACTLVQRLLEPEPPERAAAIAAAAGDTIGPDWGLEPLQPCAIRGSCRWWDQEGRRACSPCSVTPTDLGELPQAEAAEKYVEYR